jgi:hypothetical protein
MGVKISNLLPHLAELDRHEKLFLIQFLVSELSQEEGKILVAKNAYPIWSPLDAHDAAAVLKNLLETTPNERTA